MLALEDLRHHQGEDPGSLLRTLGRGSIDKDDTGWRGAGALEPGGKGVRDDASDRVADQGEGSVADDPADRVLQDIDRGAPGCWRRLGAAESRKRAGKDVSRALETIGEPHELLWTGADHERGNADELRLSTPGGEFHDVFSIVQQFGGRREGGTEPRRLGQQR